ncbi:MAG: prolyl oligopeptidase family serine peptidase [Candidatus Delongbacteria bacterium]|jgi:oligopeptidase B|nr:prolyl oligopeptidase family serine peptidase [Candidatus Delongbacteria bacterium]
MLKAKKIETKTEIHDDILIDNYRWMEDLENNKSEIMEYVKAENDFTNESLKHTEEVQKKLLKEFSSRVITGEQILYNEIDEYLYYHRKVEGEKLKNYYRKKGENGLEELVLDLNKVDGGNNYCSIHDLEISPDHKFIAYAIDKDGSEMCELFIQEVSSGKVLDDTKSDSKTKAILSLQWVSDNIIIYSSLNSETDLFQLNYRHELFTSSEDDILIFEEENKSLESFLIKSACKNYITNEAYINEQTKAIQYLDLKNPYGDFVTLIPYNEDLDYSIALSNDFAFIVKFDKNSTDILIKRLSDISDEGKMFYTPERGCSIPFGSIKATKDFIVFLERENGQNRIKVININKNSSYYLEFPEEAYSVMINKVDFKNNILQINYSSFKTPWTLVDIDLESKEKTIIRENKIKNYNPDDFVSERTYAKAEDGTLIPINLFYKKDIVMNGNNPLYLESYGNYGSTFPETEFSTSKLILAEKGFIYAVAHVRGGGFYGRKWHEDGKLLKKINSFTDLISCTEHLVEKKYTSSKKLVLKGESCGGTLVLGVANMRPELFKIVIAGVPVADVLGQMLDHSKWTFKESHFTEWGNPSIKEEYNSMKTWCPYTNIISQNYPNLFIFAGINDTRVNFWIPLRYVAKLREFNKGNNDLFINLEEVGHLGSGYDNLVVELAYIFDKLGIEYSDEFSNNGGINV